jgi:hypothetical protein
MEPRWEAKSIELSLGQPAWVDIVEPWTPPHPPRQDNWNCSRLTHPPPTAHRRLSLPTPIKSTFPFATPHHYTDMPPLVPPHHPHDSSSM